MPKGIPADTETLLLNHNRISDLHDAIPALEHLLHLDLSNNELKQLGRGHIFMNFTRLRYLDLSKNEFKTLFAGVFRGLKRLEALMLRQGALRYIDEHAFDGLENLRTLDLEENHVASVYLELFQSILNLHVSTKRRKMRKKSNAKFLQPLSIEVDYKVVQLIFFLL